MEKTNENGIAHFEHFVQFHLRTELVVRGISFTFVLSAKNLDFKILWTCLEKSDIHDFGIVNGNDACAFLRARLWIGFGMEVEESQSPADEKEDHDRDQIRFLFLYILEGWLHKAEWIDCISDGGTPSLL